MVLVSLTIPVFALQSALSQEITTRWRTAYEHGLSLAAAEDWAGAAAIFQNSWQTAENDEARGASAISLAQADRHLKHLKDAAIWYDRARTAWNKTPNGGAMMAAASLNLADLDRTAGDYNAAECVLREALSAAVAGKSRILLQNDLADLLRELGRMTEAKPLFQDSANSPDATSHSKATALIGLADISRQERAWDLSVSQWNQALELSRADRDVTSEAIELRGLASTWLFSGSAARAEPLFKRSLKLMESEADSPPEQLATVHIGLGQLYRFEQKFALAEEEWSRALDLDRAVLGETHPQVAALLEMLSDIFSARGQFDLAVDYASRACIIMDSTFGEKSMALAAALTNRAIVEERASHLDEAVRDYEHAIAISRTHPEFRPVHAAMMERYASLLKALHRGRDAKVASAEAHSFRFK